MTVFELQTTGFRSNRSTNFEFFDKCKRNWHILTLFSLLALTVNNNTGDWKMCCHSSVDSSAPSILPPRTRIPSTSSMILSNYNWIVTYRPIFKKALVTGFEPQTYSVGSDRFAHLCLKPPSSSELVESQNLILIHSGRSSRSESSYVIISLLCYDDVVHTHWRAVWPSS